MMPALTHAIESTNLADLLERVLDKGLVIAGEIHVKLVEVELLTIQLRLVVCSVDRALELGLDWWNEESRPGQAAIAAFDQRLARIEQSLGVTAPTAPMEEREQ
jgi:hypothetical protein